LMNELKSNFLYFSLRSYASSSLSIFSFFSSSVNLLSAYSLLASALTLG